MAAELSSRADQAIAIGSIDIPDEDQAAEVEEINMDQIELPPSAETWAINTPPVERRPEPIEPIGPPMQMVDLDNENEIEPSHAQAEPADDPLQLFEEPNSKPATAEASAADEEAEIKTYWEYLRDHVPHWAEEPTWVDWCDKDNPQKSIDQDTQRKHKLGEDFIELLNERYYGPILDWVLRATTQHGRWWKRDTFMSGRSTIKLSIYDTPVENSQLDLMRALPVRKQDGTLLDIQPCLFSNTQDPDILRKEVFPNRPQARKPIKDSWPTSGWENLQGPNQKRFGKAFFSWLRGEVTFRGLHQQHELPLWLLGARAGQYPPPPSSGLYKDIQVEHWRFVLHDNKREDLGAVPPAKLSAGSLGAIGIGLLNPALSRSIILESGLAHWFHF